MEKINIHCIMGKSGCGKSTVYNELINDRRLVPIVPYTTRPKRPGEVEGETYYFIDSKKMDQMRKDNKIVAYTSYETAAGLWEYAFAYDFDKSGDYVAVITPEQYQQFYQYIEKNHLSNKISLHPHLICANEEERIAHIISRERLSDNPNYKEICRRILTDKMDFSETKLKENLMRDYYMIDRIRNDYKRTTPDRLAGAIKVEIKAIKIEEGSI